MLLSRHMHFEKLPKPSIYKELSEHIRILNVKYLHLAYILLCDICTLLEGIHHEH